MSSSGELVSENLKLKQAMDLLTKKLADKNHHILSVENERKPLEVANIDLNRKYSSLQLEL